MHPAARQVKNLPNSYNTTTSQPASSQQLAEDITRTPLQVQCQTSDDLLFTAFKNQEPAHK